MENASKALIIAGGILIAILMISLVLYARSSISEYQNSKLELDRVENVAKFNEQFAQYDRKDVAGYELISLTNKVLDYNEQYSKDGHNNQGYKQIQMSIDFKSIDYLNKLTYNSSGNQLKQNTTEKDMKDFIASNLDRERVYGGEDIISKISRNINVLFVNFGTKKQALKKFYEIVPKKIRDSFGFSDLSDETVEANYDKLTKDNNGRNIKIDAYKYYEYIQFKRCIFECDNMEYDDKTGRISKITYSFVKLR